MTGSQSIGPQQVIRLRCRLICLARKSNLAASHAAKQHDGQIT